MFNIARNTTLDYLRKNKRHNHTIAPDEFMESQLVDPRTAEQAAAGSQQLNRLEKAMASLPLHHQEVIWLGRFEFNSFKSLAQALGCKTGTARVRMHRAMQLLNVAYADLNGVTNDA
jgi:RNA polymerase sigma-70 factor (ECF subfamily)